MIVNFEFLGEEPLENVITCLNFKVDKVVFFGYQETIESQKQAMKSFLTKYCGVQQVVFLSLSKTDLQSVLDTMRREVQNEINRGGKIYFDVTGGESLILVAFGMLSDELKKPLHMYDIVKDELIELNTGEDVNISEGVAKQQVTLNIDKYIEMRGGIVNHNKHKEIHDLEDREFEGDVLKIWSVAKKYFAQWNIFSHFLRGNISSDTHLNVDEPMDKITKAVSTTQIGSIHRFNQMIDDLQQEGVLRNVKRADGRYKFQFKNDKVKSCLWQGGSVLELYVYRQHKATCDDCRVGVHLDWDGIVHQTPGGDVLNEIDVLTLKGNVATFISCKSGRMKDQQSLYALYELDTVARRFGGKYAKKMLVTTTPLNAIYQERAKEMGIELVVEE